MDSRDRPLLVRDKGRRDGPLIAAANYISSAAHAVHGMESWIAGPLMTEPAGIHM